MTAEQLRTMTLGEIAALFEGRWLDEETVFLILREVERRRKEGASC